MKARTRMRAQHTETLPITYVLYNLYCIYSRSSTALKNTEQLHF